MCKKLSIFLIVLALSAHFVCSITIDSIISVSVISSNSGQSLVSHNKRYVCIMQSDGNLVVYDNNKAVWSAKVSLWVGKPPYVLAMQGDGNLVIYDSHNTAIWNTYTNTGSALLGRGRKTYAPYKLIMQNDGNLVIYDQSSAIWSSWTGIIRNR